MADFLRIPRGPIITVPGNILAETQHLHGHFRRVDYAREIRQH